MCRIIILSFKIVFIRKIKAVNDFDLKVEDKFVKLIDILKEYS